MLLLPIPMVKLSCAAPTLKWIPKWIPKWKEESDWVSEMRA